MLLCPRVGEADEVLVVSLASNAIRGLRLLPHYAYLLDFLVNEGDLATITIMRWTHDIVVACQLLWRLRAGSLIKLRHSMHRRALFASRCVRLLLRFCLLLGFGRDRFGLVFAVAW